MRANSVACPSPNSIAWWTPLESVPSAAESAKFTSSGTWPAVGVVNNMLDGCVVPLTHVCEQFGPTWSYVPEGHRSVIAVHAPIVDVVVAACGSGTAHL